jgi:DNA-binding NtrC family response regulator
MRKHILILEEARAEFEPIAKALDGDAYEFVWTQTAHEALRRANDEPFDLVLMDVDLSDADPWKVLDRFGALHPFLPVITLTEQPAQVQRATACGADASLEKPVDEQHLLQTVKQLLAESHQARMSRLMGSLHDWLQSGGGPASPSRSGI